MTNDQHEALLERFSGGSIAALARAVSVVEDRRPGFETLLNALHGQVGRAHRIGVTGPPGAGKSTLVDGLVRQYREQDLTVAVVAVDPTSPFTGGALLGDRVRMDQSAADEGVFIRSMATRGATGGLAMTTIEVCDVVDAFGFDRIIVETVGVGQSELAVAATADTTVLVLVPESGDAVQVLKAGVMEIGDLFVVNKADRPQAEQLAAELEEMLSIRAEANPDRWRGPVVRTIASQGQGIDELRDALEGRVTVLTTSGELDRERRGRRLTHTRAVLEWLVLSRIWDSPGREAALDARTRAVVDGTMSAYQAAREVLETEGE